MPENTANTKSAVAYDPNLRPQPLREGGLSWYSPADAPFQVAGLAWFAQEGVYRRLPQHPPYALPEAVDALANHPSGGQIRFRTNSRQLSVRVRLAGGADMVHMPASGQCGIDCYLGETGAQRYLSTSIYNLSQSSYESALFDLPTADMRAVTLNLPLYQGVDEVRIGLDDDAEILPPPAYAHDRRVIAYGTSITQGGCANRPGMAYTNILSRRLNLEFINLGFSGNGKGEPELARTIALIPRPGVFVLDYEANTSLEMLRDTLPGFIAILREAHPTVPILVISAIRFARELVNAAFCADRTGNRTFQRETVETLRRQGDAHIYFQNGAELLGEDFDECTVDGVHPTDLGFRRMADALEPVLRRLAL